MQGELIHNHSQLFSVGINHSTAQLEVREKMFIDSSRIPQLLDKFKDRLAECMIVSTCNRTELYGVSKEDEIDLSSIEQLLIDFNGASPAVNEKHFYRYILSGACKHLFKVASSIDSMVVGDPQIMHQIKDSYQLAADNGSTGKVLNQLVQKALHAAKRVKSETKLFEGAFSISYAAVELATKIFGELRDKKVLVVGAGETAELTLEGLLKKDVHKIFITNRTSENAYKLIENLKKKNEFYAEVLPFEKFKESLGDIDIIISSTGSNEYIITYDEYKKTVKQKRGEPVLMVDIAVPRDIDPKIDKIGNVFLKNIDDLNAIIDTNHEKRMSIIPEVNQIISQETLAYLMWYYTIPVLPALQYIQQNLNGLAGGKIKHIRNYITEHVTELHSKMILSNKPDPSEETRMHKELVENLLKLNELTIKK